MAHHQSNKPKDGAGEGCGPGQQPAGAAAYRLLLAEAGPASFAAIAEPAGWSGPQSSSRLLKLIRRLRPKPSPQKRLLLGLR